MMSEAVVVALITGAFAVLAQWLLSRSNRDKLYEKMDKDNALAITSIRAELEKNQAVTDQKIADLTREVREHNEFARRVPVLEAQMQDISGRVHDMERRGA